VHFSSRHAARRTLAATIAATIAVITILGGQSAPASAAVGDAPTGLSPDSTTVDEIPVLSWDRVEDAVAYDVQLSGSPQFTPVLASAATANVRYVPTVQLPGDADVYWQVRAKFTGGSTSAWVQAVFHRGALTRPAPLAPADGAQLQPPVHPAQFRWTAVPGATAYDVQVGSDPQFTDPTRYTTTTVKGTAYTSTSQQPPGTYYWRVRAQLGTGIVTSWSAGPGESPSAYGVLPLERATLDSPADDPLGSKPIQEVVLDWNPVAGAATYDLQLSTDENFLSNTTTVNSLTSTRYSPPSTLDNDQYYWRVRPADLTGNKPSWGEDQSVWHFRRHWPEQPALEYPADGATVGDPFFFQWAPVHLASSYTLQLSLNSSFTGPEVTTCTTTQTTYTPATADGTECMPAAAGTYYWRVLARDAPPMGTAPVTQSIYAEVHEFTYDPVAVTLQSPANGADVTVPTLRWSPVSGAARYRVTVTPVDSTVGSTVPVATTAATSFTPRVTLMPGTYRWQAQTLSEDNRVGAGTVLITQRMFTVADPDTPTATSPEPTTPESTSARFPTLGWTPVVDATKYVVRLRRAGTTAWNATTISTVQPATEDWGTGYLSPDRYEWQVEAWAGNRLLSAGSLGSFTIASLGSVTDHRVALTGTELDDLASSCQAAPPAECQNLRQTPVLRWDPIPNAAYYQLYISRDAELTNQISRHSVYGTMWTPPTAFADSNAGSAYYWLVIPCTSSGSCAPLRAADRQFNLLSNPVELSGPVGGVSRSDDVSLSWHDYLDSSAVAGPGNSTLPTPARTEARYYRVQTSVSPQFLTTLDNELVDQTTFTSFDNTYPEGTIYWRVQAHDGSTNPLTWSKIGNFEKRSPTPVAISPAADDVLDASQQLSWKPLSFAASYNLEVYKNDDTVPSVANRVISMNTKQTSYAPPTALPVSGQSYRWRVQRVDAKNRVGAWSELLPFKIAGTAPAQLSPNEGVRQDPNGALFTWGPVDRATTYRFERRILGSPSIAETKVTSALAWAPLAAVSGGSHEWRVVALDSGGNALSASEWRGFTVIDKPVTTAPQITGSGQVGTALTATQPSWNLPDVTTTFQWYRGATAVAGATENVYELTSADLNQSMKVRVTGTKAGYPAGTADSNIIKCGLGGMPSLARELVLQGTGKSGTVLSGAPTWNEQGVTTTYQWLVAGTAVSGATINSFTVRTTDVGKTVQLRVTGARTGYSPGIYTSNTVTATGPERLVASSAATISGIARVGQQLTANPGTWPSNVTLLYQWLRDGTVITGATKAAYPPVVADAARRISVRVTARKTGYLEGTSTSSGLLIPRVASRSTFTLADRTIKRTTNPRASVTVTAPAGSTITGTVSVYDGTRRLKSVSLASTSRGRVTVTLPRLSRGTHYLSVTYGGNKQLVSSKSGRLSIRVS
jgi:hypothetical protein